MAGSVDQRAPRFVFVTDVEPAPGRSARFGWRLDSANNRAVGMGVDVHESLAECRDAVAFLRDGLDSFRHGCAMDESRGAWAWKIADRDRTLATGPRAYPRRIDCRRSLERFRTAAATADPDHGVVRYRGPRALRAFGDGPDHDVAAGHRS